VDIAGAVEPVDTQGGRPANLRIELSIASRLPDQIGLNPKQACQPGQQFKPFSSPQLRAIGIPKEKMFENSTTRIFYQDKTAHNPDDTSAFSSSAPAPNGTCSCRVVVLPSIPEDVAKKIALSLSPVPDPRELTRGGRA
jgi:hypothetical protein